MKNPANYYWLVNTSEGPKAFSVLSYSIEIAIGCNCANEPVKLVCGVWTDCGEGPFDCLEHAEEFANAECGVPFEFKYVNGKWIIEVLTERETITTLQGKRQ
jgi:hypothetical protein